MQRFFVPSEVLQPDIVTLSGPPAHQLARVLRARAGDHIALFDGSGIEVEIELTSVSPQAVRGRRLQARWPEREPRVHLVLYQALLRETKYDWVLQKATELGVYAIAPLYTEHTLISSADRPSAARLTRWQRILVEAAEQSGRVALPLLRPATTLEEACAGEEPALIAALDARAQPLSQRLAAWRSDPPPTIKLLIGPEGGFTPDEVAQAIAAGGIPISLGPRVLRAETAGIAALAALAFALGEWERPAAQASAE